MQRTVGLSTRTAIVMRAHKTTSRMSTQSDTRYAAGVAYHPINGHHEDQMYIEKYTCTPQITSILNDIYTSNAITCSGSHTDALFRVRVGAFADAVMYIAPSEAKVTTSCPIARSCLKCPLRKLSRQRCPRTCRREGHAHKADRTSDNYDRGPMLWLGTRCSASPSARARPSHTGWL